MEMLPCEGLQNVGLCSALRAFEQGGIFVIVPHLLQRWASDFQALSEEPPYSVAFYDMQRDTENLFYPGSTRILLQSPL
jgi:hypothetical protein